MVEVRLVETCMVPRSWVTAVLGSLWAGRQARPGERGSQVLLAGLLLLCHKRAAETLK